MKSRTSTTLSAATLFCAGALGVGVSPAKADIDFSISLNLGWCGFDPCAPIAPVCDPWYGSWCDPCPPRWHWRGCGSSGWSGWYSGSAWCPPPSYGPACLPYRPVYQPCYAPSLSWSSGWYWGGGSSSWWYISTSPGYCGPYSVTTYYSPYYDYYRPVSHWGLSFTWSNSDCGNWGWYGSNRYNRGYRDGYRDGFDDGSATVINNTTIINNPEPAPLVGRGVRQQPLSRGAAEPAHTVEPIPAQAFGVNGPTDSGAAWPGGKGPRRVDAPAVAPVAAKPIESKPAGKPVIAPVSVKPIESKPAGNRALASKPGSGSMGSDGRNVTGRGDGRVTVSKPSLPTLAPSAKPVETVAKPAAPTVNRPTWEQPRVSKPSAPIAAPVAKPTVAPTSTPVTVPSRSAGYTKPAERPEVKPSAPVARPTPRTVSAPSVAPKPAAPVAAPTPKPTVAPAARPAAAPTRMSAPTPSRVSTPAPSRTSAPAPAPRPSAAPTAKPSGSNGGNKRG